MNPLHPIGWGVVALLGVIIAMLGASRRNSRRFISGVLLLSVAGPGWLMARGGALPRPRAYLFVIPPGDEESVRRLVEQIQAAHPRALASLVRLDPAGALVPSTPAGRPEPRWRTAAELLRDWSPLTVTTAARVRAEAGWVEQLAKAAQPSRWQRLLHGLPRLTLVVPMDEKDYWATAEATGTVDVARAVPALRNAGAHLVTVDTAADDPGRGKLEVAMSSAEITSGRWLQWLPYSIHLRLLQCPFSPVDGRYTLRAWIDRPSGAGMEPSATLPERFLQEVTSLPPGVTEPDELMLVSAAPQAERRTVFKLSAFAGAAPATGFHRLEVELTFRTSIGGYAMPVTYRATQYFEVTDRKVVVIEAASFLTRHAWIHRSAPDQSIRPTASSMLQDVLVGFRRGQRNIGRIPFSRATFHSFGTSIAPFDSVAEARLQEDLRDATMVVLVEPPNWNELKKLDATLNKFAEEGGIVMTIAPPAPSPGTNPLSECPAWLPAYGEAIDATSGVARDETTEPRVYFVVDHSRPAAVFPSALGSSDGFGARLQQQVVNRLYDKMGVTTRDGTKITDPLLLPPEGGSNLMVSAAAAQVGLFQVGAHRGLVVPPLFTRNDTGLTSVNTNYQIYHLLTDVAYSWVASRIGTLEISTRQPLYPGALKDLAKDPTGMAGPGVAPFELDAPLTLPGGYPGTIIVAFALNIAQPKDPLDVPPLGAKIWMTTAPLDHAAPLAADPKQFTDAGAKLIVVPIELNLTMKATYSSAAGLGALELKDAVQQQWGGTLLGQALRLDGQDNQEEIARQSEAVANALWTEIQNHVKQTRGQLRVHDSGRAIGLRVAPAVDPPRQWRRLVLSRPSGPAPAAVLTTAEVPAKTYPAVVWIPVHGGAACALAYSPLAHDMWTRDLGQTLDDFPVVDAPATEDGWGLQRLCDPVALWGRAAARGLTVEAVRPAPDGASALLDCLLPEGTDIFEPPALLDVQKNPTGVVVVSSMAVQQRRVTLAVSASNRTALSGLFGLRWGGVDSLQKVFLDLPPLRAPVSPVREALRLVAGLSGGRSVPEPAFQEVMPDSFAATSVGATTLIALTALLLSPWVRRWSLQSLLQLRPWPAALVDDTQGEAPDLEAAFDASGMDFGSPCAQRPIGRVVQVRAIRPGDSPLAARKSDWAFFIDDIAASLGSSPMPRVLETPRSEALSILTLLDLPPGARALDAGRSEDRLRTMTQVATLNALAAIKRKGIHQVATLQAGLDRDSLEPAPPDATEAAIARLARQSTGWQRVIPELFAGEAVLLIVNPVNDIDDTLTALARRCVEERCPLAIIFLVHPLQEHELGLMRAAAGATTAPFALMDRNGLSPADIRRYIQRRIEVLTSRIATADGLACTLRTDQPLSEVVTILSEEIWTQL